MVGGSGQGGRSRPARSTATPLPAVPGAARGAVRGSGHHSRMAKLAKVRANGKKRKLLPRSKSSPPLGMTRAAMVTGMAPRQHQDQQAGIPPQDVAITPSPPIQGEHPQRRHHQHHRRGVIEKQEGVPKRCGRSRRVLEGLALLAFCGRTGHVFDDGTEVLLQKRPLHDHPGHRRRYGGQRAVEDAQPGGTPLEEHPQQQEHRGRRNWSRDATSRRREGRPSRRRTAGADRRTSASGR